MGDLLAPWRVSSSGERFNYLHYKYSINILYFNKIINNTFFNVVMKHERAKAE